MPKITPQNSTPYTVPLKPQNQEFDIALNGVTYHLIIRWNGSANCWFLTIEDSQRNPIVNGLPMVTGCDLLEQFAYLGLGGAFVVQSSTSPDTVPDYPSLGVTGNLFFLIPVAAAA